MFTGWIISGTLVILAGQNLLPLKASWIVDVRVIALAFIAILAWPAVFAQETGDTENARWFWRWVRICMLVSVSLAKSVYLAMLLVVLSFSAEVIFTFSVPRRRTGS